MSDIKAIASQMKQIKAELEDAKIVASELQKEFDHLRKVTLPEAMEEEGIESVRVSGVGTVQLRSDAYVSIRTGMKEEAYQWLEDNEYGSLIAPYVQPSTLKAFCKEQIKEGVELPDDLFSFEPYTYAVITK